MNESEVYPVERWSDVADALCGCRVTVGRSDHELKRLPLEFSPLEFSFDYSPIGECHPSVLARMEAAK